MRHTLAILLLTPILLIALASPVTVTLYEKYPGFYMLEEPEDAKEVQAEIMFANSTWTVYANASEVAYDSETCRQRLVGVQPWSLWIVRGFPEEFPYAHIGTDPNAPLLPEFSKDGILGNSTEWVVVLHSGKLYWCDRWREGGTLLFYTTIDVPEASQAVVRLRVAQVGGVSPVDNEQYDTDLTVIIEAGNQRVTRTYTLGDGGLNGWSVVEVDITGFAGKRVVLTLSPEASGYVRACKVCTGYWDREFVGVDWVEVVADGDIVFHEDFKLSTAQEIAQPPITTTTRTTTTTTQTTETRTSETTVKQTTTTRTTVGETAREAITQTTGTRQTTTQQTQETSTRIELPIPVNNGDKLVYNVRFEAKGPEGEGKTSGKIEITIEVGEETIDLKVTSTDLSIDASLASLVFSDITDLASLIAQAAASKAVGKSGPLGLQTYTLPDLDTPYTCPILKPGAQGAIEGEKPSLVQGVSTRYKCVYSNGVLTRISLNLEGEYQGSSVKAVLDAELVSSTIEDLGDSHEAGPGVDLRLALAALLVVVVVALIVVARRR